MTSIDRVLLISCTTPVSIRAVQANSACISTSVDTQPLLCRHIPLISEKFAACLVHRDSTVVDRMKTLLAYAGAFYLEYFVKFFDTCIKDIVDVILSSKYVLAGTMETCTRYIRFTKLFINYRALHPLFERLSREGRQRRFLAGLILIARFCIALSPTEWHWW